MAQHELLPVGTELAAGDPAPPTTHDKANAGLLWGLVPVVIGGLLVVLQSADVLFPGAPTWVSSGAAVLVLLLGPVASYFGVKATPNRLLQPVITN